MTSKVCEPNQYFYGRPENQGRYEHAIGIFAAHESLHSEKTSSLPLVAFWSTINKRQHKENLKNFTKATTIRIPSQGTTFCFEYSVPAQGGRGKSSMTDLMIFTPDKTIAVEAKYTECESPYETIAHWLAAGDKTKDSGNRMKVLQGWWNYITATQCVDPHYKSITDIPDYGSIPYQLLHRIASACAVSKRNQPPSVIYQIFYDDTSAVTAKKFAGKLSTHFISLGIDPSKLLFKIILTKVVPPAIGDIPITDMETRKIDFNELFIRMLDETNSVYSFGPTTPFP